MKFSTFYIMLYFEMLAHMFWYNFVLINTLVKLGGELLIFSLILRGSPKSSLSRLNMHNFIFHSLTDSRVNILILLREVVFLKLRPLWYRENIYKVISKAFLWWRAQVLWRKHIHIYYKILIIGEEMFHPCT